MVPLQGALLVIVLRKSWQAGGHVHRAQLRLSCAAVTGLISNLQVRTLGPTSSPCKCGTHSHVKLLKIQLFPLLPIAPAASHSTAGLRQIRSRYCPFTQLTQLNTSDALLDPTCDDKLPYHMLLPCEPVDTAPPMDWSMYQGNAGRLYPNGACGVLIVTKHTKHWYLYLQVANKPIKEIEI